MYGSQPYAIKKQRQRRARNDQLGHLVPELCFFDILMELAASNPTSSSGVKNSDLRSWRTVASHWASLGSASRVSRLVSTTNTLVATTARYRHILLDIISRYHH